MALDPRCLVAVVEFADGRYVQFWVTCGGTVIAEVVSNFNIGDAVALSDLDETSLRAMGWHEPTAGPNPNWRVQCNDGVGLWRVVAMTRRAVYDVLGERPNRPITLRSWEFIEPSDTASDDDRERARVGNRPRRRGPPHPGAT